MSAGSAIVKNVLSGDTITLQHPTQRIEKMLTFSHVAAPRIFSRKAGSTDQTDEPFAWDSREALRKLIIGKPVRFVVQYHHSGLNRDFGRIFMPDPASNGQTELDVVERLVADGWLRVRQNLGNPKDDEEAAEIRFLEKLERDAQGNKRGMFDPEAKPTKVQLWGTFSVQEALKDVLRRDEAARRRSAIVEQVIDAGFWRVLVIPSNFMFLVRLSGVLAPSTRPKGSSEAGSSEEDAQSQAPQPFAVEAKEWVEQRVLGRQVTIRFDQLDSAHNTVYVSLVNQQNKSFAEAILAEGFAKIHEPSLSTAFAAPSLRQAEVNAKAKHLRIWKDFVGATQTTPPVEEFSGTVLEVISGDCIVIKADQSGEVRRLNLASIRAPRFASVRKGDDAGVSSDGDEAWAYEAKEMLRTQLIGKPVRVAVDYVRLPQGAGAAGDSAQATAQQPRSFASVYSGKRNVTADLVRNGMVQLVKHRADEEKSRDYGQLQVAEGEAKSEKRGIFSGVAPPKHHVNDLSVAAGQKTKQFLPFLQRAGRQPAVVTYVSSGSRFRVFVLRDSCMISFALEGIRTPQPSRQAQRGDPFGDDSFAFAREMLMQRDVEVEVMGVDQKGTFLGNLFLERVNFAVRLVELGLASVHPSADRLHFATDLRNAEERARQARAGIFSLESEAQAQQAGGSRDQQKGARVSVQIVEQPEFLRIVVTQVVDGCHFYAQMEANTVEAIQRTLESFSLDQTLSPTVPFSVGSACFAKFAEDGRWYRGKVTAVFAKERELDVFFVDFGNTERIQLKDVRDLKSVSQPGVNEPAQAFLCRLALVSTPPLSSEMGGNSALQFTEMLGDRPLVAQAMCRVIAPSTKLVHVLLLDYDRKLNLNSEMVSRGLARVQDVPVSRRSALPLFVQESLTSLEECQENAKRARRNIWQYGDVFYGEGEDESGSSPHDAVETPWC